MEQIDHLLCTCMILRKSFNWICYIACKTVNRIVEDENVLHFLLLGYKYFFYVFSYIPTTVKNCILFRPIYVKYLMNLIQMSAHFSKLCRIWVHDYWKLELWISKHCIWVTQFVYTGHSFLFLYTTCTHK